MTPLATRLRRAAFRFFVYGSFLVAGEVAFYTLVKAGRLLPPPLASFFQFLWRVDERLDLGRVWAVPIRTLYGQASLWMFFVYGAIALFGLEAAWHRVKGWNVLARGAVYMLVILSMECAAGWALVALTGYEIWYYADRWAVLRYTSLAIGPLWFGLGLLSENFLHIIDKLTRVKVELEAALSPGARPPPPGY